ncbi:hypothetical protein DPEC_G00291470 [Dallia pectoralis]|uniref:Uncharacterized protein n=1 Tax=Dallia pectoralis TaxID=75939 RepID=A0ACC2FHH3_DALPE|nr:hypothetical protein DPEC_G00291470 [Dallia pectoralis]
MDMFAIRAYRRRREGTHVPRSSRGSWSCDQRALPTFLPAWQREAERRRKREGGERDRAREQACSAASGFPVTRGPGMGGAGLAPVGPRLSLGVGGHGVAVERLGSHPAADRITPENFLMETQRRLLGEIRELCEGNATRLGVAAETVPPQPRSPEDALATGRRA